ncbi:hypothetical protein KEM48_000416 [Puccinia striiformis f. sp. tritici PST-130]|nr:hypothetical protein KEM48_000416 [Puccinia striiformis f. sp. tritici PST-130]
MKYWYLSDSKSRSNIGNSGIHSLGISKNRCSLLNNLRSISVKINPTHATLRKSDHTTTHVQQQQRDQDLTTTDPQQQKEELWWSDWKNRIISLDSDTRKPDHNQDLLLPPDTKRIKLSSTNIAHQSSLKSRLIDQNNPDLRPESVESISVSMDLRDDELRIPINLDIISGNIHLTDRFEWEISELNNSPEEFVEVYVNDLGLAGEFKTAITHSIREQIATYVKSLALVEHSNGYPVPNDELRYAFLQRVTEPIRTGQVDDFTPFLNLLNAEELDRQEKEHDREARRKRRQTRSRRGITLPDRESQRTVRSIVPIQGIKMVMPYQNDNDDVIMPLQPVAEPFAIEESAVEIPEPSEHPPKRHIPVSKEVQVPESQMGTPNKATGSRVSRRLRGATADVVPSVEKDDAPTPSNAGTPAPSSINKRTNNKPDPSNNPTASKKPLPASSRTTTTTTTTQTGAIDWESMGLHDPMIDGVWHCSNCGCPDQIAIGRRKGLGGKDTLCGECDKAKQAIADQEVLRKDKNKTENQNLSSSLNSSKKRKKDGRNSLLPKSELIRRGEERADSVVSSNRSAASRESSPVGSVRSNKNSGPTEKPPPKKRAPTTRAQKSISKTIVVSSRRSSTKAEKILPKKVLIKNEEDLDQPTSKSPSVSGTRQENNQKRKQLRSKDQSDNKAKKGSKTPEEDQEEESSKLAPGGSRTGSISGSVTTPGGQRRSITNGRITPPPITTARKIEHPQWMTDALNHISISYPDDQVELFPRPKKQAINPVLLPLSYILLVLVNLSLTFTYIKKSAEVSHQHPQLSPYDGSQQISPTNDLHQQRSRTGSQISPTENGQQVHQDHPTAIRIESASLPPITTTLAAAESTAPQDQEPARSPGPDGDEEVVAGDHSSRSPTDNNVPPAPSSLDGVALQENNYMDYSRDDEDEEEEGKKKSWMGSSLSAPSNHLPPFLNRPTGGQGTHLPSSHHNHHNQLHYLPNHNHNHHPNQHHHQLHGHAHGNSNDYLSH